MPQPDYTIRQNDSGEAITAILKDAAGDAVDLTDATLVFQLARIAGGGLVVEADAEFSGDGSDGGVSYTWQAEDTAAAGWYLASWRVTLDGVIQTYPLGTYTLVQIVGELGAIPAATAPTALWPPVGWTVSPIGELLIEPPGDGDATIDSLTLKEPTDFDSYTPFRILDVDGNVVASIGRTGAMVLAELSISEPDGSFDMQATNALVIEVQDTSSDYVMVTNSQGVATWGIKALGQEYTTPGNGAPDDSTVLTSERLQWYEDTVGAPKQRIKERDSDGTLFSRIAAVLTEDATAFAGITKPLLGASPTVAQISTVLAGLGLTRQT